ncbi:lipocalin family protein [Brevundimonas sp. SL130]|uniref:lipocalin family protein n=1 Tax=Brevundimonas sp. SL130 TaxID=2995143 RepID=UPI00226D23AB|nr:lipocalin family protein [Brevundimonas sp. SL130]WAC59740.1 lipocalin family protein [Brevundimonas sp. SL130]
MTKHILAALMGVGAVFALSACVSLQSGPVGNTAVPEPAKAVDLTRYAGRWYEIARYEAGFQRGCEASTATYGLRPDGLISVLNTCRQDEVDGALRSIEGKAKVIDSGVNAKLKVSFFGPFYFGNYWVLDHAEDYSWSIVGEPSGRYLWLLSRTPAPSSQVRDTILSRARDLGYDLSLLRMTKQPEA